MIKTNLQNFWQEASSAGELERLVRDEDTIYNDVEHTIAYRIGLPHNLLQQLYSLVAKR